jgi:hypothetical protein
MPGFGSQARLTAQSVRTVQKLKGAKAYPALRKEMVAAGRPMVQAAKRAARRLPSKRSRRKTPGGSLRNAVASAITQKNKFSSKSVMVLIKEVPKGGKSNLATVLEGTKPWTHPTFGHGPEVDQESHPFFYKTLSEMEPEIGKALSRVLKKFERML